MMFSIVNGYVCYNCTDVEYAKKGVNPAHPKAHDASSSKTGSTTGAGKANPAVILGGSLIDSGTAGDGTAASTGSSAPVGAKLNLSI